MVARQVGVGRRSWPGGLSGAGHVVDIVSGAGEVIDNADYLADGITEGITNSLSQLRGVKVIARVSAFRYKGQPAEPQRAAHQLGVRGIIIGRVSLHGDELGVAAELVDASENRQLWGSNTGRSFQTSSRFRTKSQSKFALSCAHV